jgi:hypothetical protein
MKLDTSFPGTPSRQPSQQSPTENIGLRASSLDGMDALKNALRDEFPE